LELTKGKPLYTFYDGPPFATGLPHYGHIAAGTIKVRENSEYKSRNSSIKNLMVLITKEVS
jgi:isoleucyl-tRNA synthetase